MEMISIQEMMNVENKTKTLEKLIETMGLYEQGKIELQRFEEARDTIECKQCSKVIYTGEQVHSNPEVYTMPEDGLCHKCKLEKERNERLEKEQKELLVKWKTLLLELNKLSDNQYELEQNEKRIGLPHIFIKRKKTGLVIQREAYGNRWKSQYALRIYTNNFDIKANKLINDFKSKGVADKLHKKANELLKQLEEIKERKEKEENLEQHIFKNVKKLFNVDKVYEKWIHAGHRRRGYQNGYYFDFPLVKGSIEIRTVNGDLFFIDKVQGMYTAENIKKVIKFIEKQNEEKNAFCEKLMEK